MKYISEYFTFSIFCTSLLFSSLESMGILGNWKLLLNYNQVNMTSSDFWKIPYFCINVYIFRLWIINVESSLIYKILRKKARNYRIYLDTSCIFLLFQWVISDFFAYKCCSLLTDFQSFSIHHQVVAGPKQNIFWVYCTNSNLFTCWHFLEWTLCRDLLRL